MFALTSATRRNGTRASAAHPSRPAIALTPPTPATPTVPAIPTVPVTPTVPATPLDPGRRSTVALRGWIAATAVYLTAVFQRSSLGVAGLQAAKRFDISPAQLSVFVLLQLGVYAAMQVPTGILVDRFGPRRLLTAAAGTMALAQFVFAVAPDYPSALAARALLGCGDALTFVSVLRFAATNFRPRQYPLLVAATAVLGSVGNVLATLPLSILLRHVGWTPSFAGAALASAAAGTLVWFVLPDSASTERTRRRLSELGAPARRVAQRVAIAWHTPGTRLGFWVHFSTMSTATVFSVLWGVPYLVAQGYSESAASTVLLTCVALGVIASPLVGWSISRHAAWRIPLALTACTLTLTSWGLLLGLGGDRPPHLAVSVLCVFTAVGGPVSTIGFALARDYNGAAIVGTASGVVNIGGFLASIIGASVVGVVLSLQGATSAHAYRLAFAALLLIQLGGTVQVGRWWRRARANAIQAQRRGEPVPVPVVAHRWDLYAEGR